ncbi:SLC10A3_5 [Lepeophtheirus salmonis]|uniref:SLC10A3_5 n=1 Tax=Lepeophtheirus salmonis TaxID=72036 RepID=A0A7R8CCK4_LEPSM|nr:SLC10A3_5 [Lepeophtheirus salmonis]CAF2770185.1 SLC10A3_5 [Lepeophtheirus salmonis]
MKLTEYDSTELKATCVNCPPELKELTLSTSSKKVAWISAVEGSDIYHQKRSLLESDYDQSVVVPLREGQVGNWTIAFNVTADFLGFSKIKASLSPSSLVPSSTLKMSVLRRPTVASRIFTSSVAILISLAYINMGCAMDLDVVKSNLKSPVGPIIGFLSQFIAMPLISFALGFVFVDSAPLRLGLFVTGVSPGGGASNIWTLMLGGSLDLSLTMTTISTLSAFFMMPLWLFTLGQFILTKLTSRYKNKGSKSIKVYVWCVGMALPWFGFMFGWIVSILCDRKMEDKIAIAIETGIQNTGVSIFILWFTLDRPLGDLAAVIPVGAAMMTPIPLLCGLIFLKIKSTFCAKSTEYTSGNIEDGSFTRDGKAALSTVSSIVKLSALDNRNLEPLA